MVAAGDITADQVRQMTNTVDAGARVQLTPCGGDVPLMGAPILTASPCSHLTSLAMTCRTLLQNPLQGCGRAAGTYMLCSSLNAVTPGHHPAFRTRCVSKRIMSTASSPQVADLCSDCSLCGVSVRLSAVCAFSTGFTQLASVRGKVWGSEQRRIALHRKTTLES